MKNNHLVRMLRPFQGQKRSLSLFVDTPVLYAPYDGGVFFRIEDLAYVSRGGLVGLDKATLSYLLNVADEGNEWTSKPKPIEPAPEGFKHSLEAILRAPKEEQ